jgi:tetratricopeptide (TPR) repeat protein
MGRNEHRAEATTAPTPYERALLLLAFAAIGLLAFRQVGSVDIGFHLKAGEAILSGAGWPTHDTFTYTVNDHPYVDTSWGYQVVAALVHRAASTQGLVLLHVAFVLGIFLVLYRTSLLVPADPVSRATLMLLGGLACEMRFETRPEILSYLLLALVLHVLHRHAEGLPSPLWALPLIHLVWANVHSLFVLGWAAVLCFAVGVSSRRGAVDRRLAAWGAACLPVTLLNPYGFRGVAFPFTLASRFRGTNAFAQTIGEFASPFALRLSEKFPFYPRVPIFSFRLFLILSLVGTLVAFRRKRYACTLLWIVFAPLAYKMIRNLPILVVAALPATIWALPLRDLLSKLTTRRSAPAVTRLVSLGLATAAFVLCARVVSDAYYVASRREDRFGWAWNRGALAVDTAEFLRRVPAEGRLLNHLNLGGYLMWATDRPVFIDGRLEVVGEEFFSFYQSVLDDEGALEACVARYGIRWLAFPYPTYPQLLGRVSRDARWRLAHVDPVAAVFGRDGPEAKALVDPALGRDAPGPVALETLPGLGGGDRRGPSSDWVRGLVPGEEFPSDDASLGLFHLYRGELPQAEGRFERAIRRTHGAVSQFYYNLGAVLYRARRFDEARRCYRVVLEDEPENRVARERSAEPAPR